MKRFSTLAAVSVALIVATGGFQIWHRVGSIAALLQTPYGQTLSIKLMLVLVLLGLGALNRFVIVPKLSFDQAVSRKLFRTVAYEIGVALPVLVCVAILLQLPPARHQLDSEYKVSGHPADHMIQEEPRHSQALPAEGASVKILTPKDGEVFSGDQVPVRFQLVKGKRSGHVHVYVDGELMGMFISDNGTLSGIPPGRHTLEAKVVANDHVTELDTGDRVQFSVK